MIDLTSPQLTDEQRAVKYLVTESDGTTHLPYTDSDGKPDHRLMGAAFAALHGGYRGKKYAGPDKDKAIEKLTAVYKSEKMDTPEEKNSAPADETRVGFKCPACGYEGDTDDIEGMNSAPKFDERRATVARIGRQFRSLPKDITRALSQETQDGIKLVQQCRAAAYGVLSYICYMPYDAFDDSLYSTIYECSMCCDVCVSLAGRESPLASEAHELCAAACREAVTASAGTNDALIQGLANLCMKTATACDAMGAAGETEEGRAARNNQDIVRSCKFETRASSDGHIKGYPILFNEFSKDLGGFIERILPDAVHYDPDGVRCDFNHDPNYILGRTTAGTLTLTTDERGVHIDADPPDTSWARDLKISMDRGDIDQGSFAFRILPGGQTISISEDGQQIRTLTNIMVRKVSIVSDPAYVSTSLHVRSGASETATEAPPVVPAVEPPPASAVVPAPKLSTIHLRRKLELEASA
jgi:HK97 family phage prohead protease